MRFCSLEKLINLHDGYRQSFRIDQLNLLLLQTGGELHVVEGQCPHKGHSLADAEILDKAIRCPLHGYRFKLCSGALIYPTEQPCRDLKTYEVVYRGNEIGVMLDI